MADEKFGLARIEDRLLAKQYDVLAIALEDYKKIKERCKDIKEAYEKNNLEEMLTGADYVSNFWREFEIDFAEQLSFMETMITGKEVWCGYTDIMDWVVGKTNEITFASNLEKYTKFFDRELINGKQE